jgi:predicted DNA-binding protein
VVKKKQRTGVSLQLWLPPELADRLTETAWRNRRTKTAEVILALERYLEEPAAAEPKPPSKRSK